MIQHKYEEQTRVPFLSFTPWHCCWLQCEGRCRQSQQLSQHLVDDQAKPAWKGKGCASSQKYMVNWWIGKKTNLVTILPTSNSTLCYLISIKKHSSSWFLAVLTVLLTMYSIFFHLKIQLSLLIYLVFLSLYIIYWLLIHFSDAIFHLARSGGLLYIFSYLF